MLSRFSDNLIKIGKIIIIVLVLIIFGVSLYFNWMYFKGNFIFKSTFDKPKIATGENQQSNFPKMIIGQVINIQSNSIEINTEKQNKNILLNNKTEFIKSYRDPFKPKIIITSVEEIKKDAFVSIILTSNSSYENPVAQKVELTIQNSIFGKIESIDQTTLKINSNDKVYEVELYSDTPYYRITSIATASQESQNQQLISKNPEESSRIEFKDIKVGDQAEVFFDDDVNVPNQIVNKVVILD